jgi:hypothetical protein
LEKLIFMKLVDLAQATAGIRLMPAVAFPKLKGFMLEQTGKTGRFFTTDECNEKIKMFSTAVLLTNPISQISTETKLTNSPQRREKLSLGSVLLLPQLTLSRVELGIVSYTSSELDKPWGRP